MLLTHLSDSPCIQENNKVDVYILYVLNFYWIHYIVSNAMNLPLVVFFCVLEAVELLATWLLNVCSAVLFSLLWFASNPENVSFLVRLALFVGLSLFVNDVLLAVVLLFAGGCCSLLSDACSSLPKSKTDAGFIQKQCWNLPPSAESNLNFCDPALTTSSCFQFSPGWSEADPFSHLPVPGRRWGPAACEERHEPS